MKWVEVQHGAEAEAGARALYAWAGAVQLQLPPDLAEHVVPMCPHSYCCFPMLSAAQNSTAGAGEGEGEEGTARSEGS